MEEFIVDKWINVTQNSTYKLQEAVLKQPISVGISVKNGFM